MSSLVEPGRPGHSTSTRTTESARVDAADRDLEAELAQVFADYVDADVSLWRYSLVRPITVLRSYRDIAALPALDADLPSTAEAEAVRAQLLEHATSRRVMLGVSAVLETPTTPGTYVDGAARQTLRRKIRAAEKQGVTVRIVPVEERAGLLSLANLHEQANEREEYRNPSPENDDLLEYELWIAAYDAYDQPIMLSVTPCAGEWAVLRYFRTLIGGQASSDARYLMARELAEALAARGVRRLVDSARPHWLPNGLRHFQRMIGFRLVRIPRVRITEG